MPVMLAGWMNSMTCHEMIGTEDGALVTRVADLAPLGVRRAVLERAVLGVLVNLGDAVPSVSDDDVNLGFFPAHQRANHVLNDAVIDERLEGVDVAPIAFDCRPGFDGGQVCALDYNTTCRIETHALLEHCG